MVKKHLKAENTDIKRTVRHELRRFIAILLITMLGVMMFSGLQASCNDLRHSADAFFDAQHLHDLIIQSSLGLTDEDIQVLNDMQEVEKTVGIYRKDVTAYAGGSSLKTALETLNDAGIDEPYLLEGRMPESNNEVLATSKFLYDASLKVGDTFTIKEETEENEDPAFPIASYTIAGSCTDPRDVNNPFEAVSYRSDSSTDTVFVLPSAVHHDVYTAVLVQMKGSEELFCFGETYEKKIKELKETIQNNISGKQEKRRTEEVIREARTTIQNNEKDVNAQLEDAEKQLEEAENTLVSSEAELSHAQDELNRQKEEAEAGISQGQTKINDSLTLLNENKKRLDEAGRLIVNGRQQLVDAREQLESRKAEIDRNRNSLTDMQIAAGEQLDTLNESKEKLSSSLNTAWPEDAFNAYSEKYEEAYIQALMQNMSDPVIEETDELKKAEQDLQEQINGMILISPGLSSIADQIIPLARGIAVAEGSVFVSSSGLQEIEGSEQQLTQAELQLDEQEKQLAASEAEYQNGLAQYNAAYKQLQEGQQQLNEQRTSAYTAFNDAQNQIDDGLRALAEGKEELVRQKSSLEENKTEAETEIADAYDSLNDIDPAVWYIQDRTALSGYTNIQSDADSISSIGTVFPVIFLLVAVLISLTAVTRMVEEERGIIGTYKSLGYDNHEIRKKYIRFVTAASLCGSVLGTIFGFIILPLFIFSVFKIMYLLPTYSFHWLWPNGIGGPVIFLLAVNGAALLACNTELSETPAALMRPKAPRAGKRVLLEKWNFIWKRMSFLKKVTARNLFRYKKRMFMTIFGIAGCMSLLLFGFSIRDSVHDLMPRQYGNINRYDILTVTEPDAYQNIYEQLDKDRNIASLCPAMITRIQLSGDDQEETEQLVVLPDHADFSAYVQLIDLDNRNISLNKGDVAITHNLAITMNLQTGSEVEGQLPDLQKNQLVITSVVQNYLGNYVYMTESTYKALYEDYELNALFIHTSDQCTDQKGYTQHLKNKAGVLSSISTEELSETFSSSFQLINSVVLIVIGMSAALAFVVLYTLSTTNISEREREIATMKVLGFYDREVHAYIDSETMILTLIGIVLGMPLGYLFSRTLSVILKLPSIYLEPSLHAGSYCICAVLCIVFALLVRLVTDRSLDKIDPVTALKSVE